LVLQKESPAILVDMLEAVVALMRNRNAANNIDVEIYFAEYKKLKLKCMTLDPTPKWQNKDKHMTGEMIEQHEQSLKAQQNNFLDKKWQVYQPVLQWALLFCVYAKDKLQQTEFQNRLDELNESLAATMDELKTCQTVEELLVGGAAGDADKGALASRRAMIEEMLQADTRQAMDCQQQLADYEAIYHKILSTN
jgi:hypothetical protein